MPVRERPEQQADQGLPDWSAIDQDEGGTSRRAAAAAIVFRVVAALAVAAFLWWKDHHIPAIVLVSVMTLATVASLVLPPFSRALRRAEKAIQRVAGRGLSLVLLGAIQLLVFTPLSLLLRVVRHNPLALGQDSDADSFWRASPEHRGKPLYRRPFSYERVPGSATRAVLPLLKLRAVLGLIVLVLALDMGLGATLDALRGSSDSGSGSQQATVLLAADVAANDGEPWRSALSREISEAGEQQRYHPTLGWFTSGYRGRHVNVDGGIRRSYQAGGTTGGNVPRVYFFGGSTMFGVFQRDEHTIPSEVARLAEADGLRVRVVNRGQLAYVNWQEVQLLQQLVTGGSKPDVAVFYDGFNELLSQFGTGAHSEPGNVQAREIERRLTSEPSQADDGRSPPRLIYDAWADVSVTHRVGRRLGLFDSGAGQAARLEAAFPDQTDRPGRKGRFAASIHARGVDVADRLARSYGFQTLHFWQPSIYSKRVVEGEEALRNNLGADPEAWTSADRVARRELRTPVRDIGDALNGIRQPVMYDFVHTNERGARAVARAIYRDIEPELRRLNGRTGP